MQLKVKKIRDAIARKWVLVKQRGLKPPHQHGPMFLIIKKQGGLNQKKATAYELVERTDVESRSHLPNDVAAGGQVVVGH